jgi:HEAT repeat protein
LGSAEREKVGEGLRRMKEIGKPSVIAPVSRRLRQGLPPTLAQLAMEALAKTGKPQAAPVLIELCGHRRAATRRAAVGALGQLGVRGAVKVLRDALDDGDAGVRAAAARALGRIGGRGALKDLYAAFERGESGALPAIASVARPRDLERLVGYLDQHSMTAFEPVYLEILQRKNFPSRGKLDLIARLGERETPSAEKFLRDLPKRLPKAGRMRLMRAVGRALKKMRKRRVEFAKEGGKKQGPAGSRAGKAGGEDK